MSKIIYCFLAACITLSISCSSSNDTQGNTGMVLDMEHYELSDSSKVGNYVVEASGLCQSYTMEGKLWTHDDSGNDASVYLLNTEGEMLKKYDLPGMKNRDWEAISSYRDARSGKSYLLIAEIGDNKARYDAYKIYKIPEPRSLEDEISDYETFSFTYENGARDAETLLHDPADGTVYVMSKRENNIHVYRIKPHHWAEGSKSLKSKLRLPFNMLVDGSVSADGQRVLLKTYTNIYYWERKKDEPFLEMLQREPILLPYRLEPQGEAISFLGNGTAFYTLSEKIFTTPRYLYEYRRVE